MLQEHHVIDAASYFTLFERIGSFHKSDQKTVLGRSVLNELIKEICAIKCSYLLKMSDCLPTSCHELNEHLLAKEFRLCSGRTAK